MKRQIAVIAVLAMLCAAAPAAQGTGGGYSAAPIAENMELSTYKNVTRAGTLTAHGSESAVCYLAQPPKKGTVAVSTTGEFVYTPAENARGRDSFTWYAMDENGRSNTATVRIRIGSQTSGVSYADIDGTKYEYPAAALVERGVYVGEQVGVSSFFRPTEQVSRGRFLAMVMNLCGAEVIDGVVRTGYDDDEAIPMWTKPYAAAAVMTGVLDAAQPQLESERPITAGEAMVMLNSAMKLTDVACDSDSEAVQAMANLSACRIADTADSEAVLTMGEAAVMLANAAEVLDRR